MFYEQQDMRNTFGQLIPLSIVIIAVASTAAVFFISIHQYKAEEVPERTEELLLQATYEPKVITSSLPVSEQTPVLIKPELPPQLPIELAEEIIDTIVDTDQVLLDVPFISQAPFGEWDDPRQDYGCEETSFLMVLHYLEDKPLTATVAKKEIINLSDWELEQHGEFRDSSAEDTVDWFSEYFGLEDVELTYEVTLEDIKGELKRGNPVIVPVDGQILDNPYYTPPGPLHHMMVIIGFDDNTNELITNDPGTRRGRHIRYSYKNFYESLRDYDTGHGLPVTEIRKPMIVIKKTHLENNSQ